MEQTSPVAPYPSKIVSPDPNQPELDAVLTKLACRLRHGT